MVAVVGKGLVYDTGGLNLKPTGSMEGMYLDKHGACTVIGFMDAIGMRPNEQPNLIS